MQNRKHPVPDVQVPVQGVFMIAELPLPLPVYSQKSRAPVSGMSAPRSSIMAV